MPYTKTAWKDRVVEKPMTFTMVTNADGTITLTPAEGAIIDPGTPINADVMNKVETQYEQALIDCLPIEGGFLTGALSSNSDIITTGNTGATDANFTGVTELNVAYVTDLNIKDHLNISSPNGDTKTVITTKDDTDANNNGFGVAFGAGGSTLIGGGESAAGVLGSSLVATPGTEIMFVTSDNDVRVLTGMQDVATDATVGKRFIFASNGDFQLGGGNGADTNIGFLRYAPATKTLTIGHWTGAASTYTDVVLSVGDIDFGKAWIDLPLITGLSDYSASTPTKYMKKGNVVYICGALKGLTGIGTTVATLPTGFRPTVPMSFALPTSGKNFARWTVGTTGAIVIENVSQAAAPLATDWFPITMSFPIE